ncbi:MAG: IclR family transcriptional regulator [Hyphomicrobiales bacterium]|nr:IclR family transcriptional regulator [Hyphomicrobiales bacterium]
MSEKIVRIVDRAATIMAAFGASSVSLSLPDLSARAGLAKPTAFRLATVLVRLGWLEQQAGTGAYTLGNAALHHAHTLLGAIPMRGVLRPVMETLRDEINETVVLSLRDGDFRYNIDSVESRHTIGQTQQIGVAIPLYAGAASRVLLAAQPNNAVQAYLARTDIRAYTGATLTQEAVLLQELRSIRETGVAVSAGEFTSGAHAVAALFRQGDETAALHFSIPAGRFSPELAERCKSALLAAAQALHA